MHRETGDSPSPASGAALPPLGRAESPIGRLHSVLRRPHVARLVAFLQRRSGGGVAQIGPELANANSVLVVRLDGIGDAAMSTGFLRELRSNLPDARVTLVAAPATMNLLETCPYIDELLPCGSEYSKWQPLVRDWRAAAFARRHLRGGRFDMALLPRWDTDWSIAPFLAYYSGAAQRVGYSEAVNPRKAECNRGFDCLLTTAFVHDGLKHEVERNLDLLRLLGARVQDAKLEVWLTQEDRSFAQSLLSPATRAGRPVVAVAPGANEAKREWPLAMFHRTAAELVKMGFAIVVVGGKADSWKGEHLQSRLTSCVNIAGHATLRETAATLQRCTLFIGNDSGAMHLAACAGTPVIEISCHPEDGAADHPNSAARFGPWQVPHRVLQPWTSLAPCVGACSASSVHCIQQIQWQRALQAAVELLQASVAVRTAGDDLGDREPTA